MIRLSRRPLHGPHEVEEANDVGLSSCGNSKGGPFFLRQATPHVYVSSTSAPPLNLQEHVS